MSKFDLENAASGHSQKDEFVGGLGGRNVGNGKHLLRQALT